MGRIAELAHEREKIEQEIAIARMEIEHDALPKSYAENLEINRALRSQLGNLLTFLEVVPQLNQKLSACFYIAKRTLIS